MGGTTIFNPLDGALSQTNLNKNKISNPKILIGAISPDKATGAGKPPAEASTMTTLTPLIFKPPNILFLNNTDLYNTRYLLYFYSVFVGTGWYWSNAVYATGLLRCCEGVVVDADWAWESLVVHPVVDAGGYDTIGTVVVAAIVYCLMFWLLYIYLFNISPNFRIRILTVLSNRCPSSSSSPSFPSPFSPPSTFPSPLPHLLRLHHSWPRFRLHRFLITLSLILILITSTFFLLFNLLLLS